MVIEMDVLGRNDHLLEFMLGVGHPAHDVPLVVVVDECDGAGHVAPPLPLPLDQFPADQVPQSFRAVGVLFFPDQAIKTVQEGLPRKPRNEPVQTSAHRVTLRGLVTHPQALSRTFSPARIRNLSLTGEDKNARHGEVPPA
jgi:hypothetical protein